MLSLRKLVNKFLMVPEESEPTDLKGYLKMIESGKLHNKLCYGIAEDKRGFHIVDPKDNPGSLSVGSMGSGKSVGIKFTLITRMLSNSEHDFFVLVDPLKGMADYSCLFPYTENVVTALNNPAKLVTVIDMLHAECMARKDAFSEVQAPDIYTYEKIMKKKNPNFRLARIVICFEEFHLIPNSEYIKFGYKVDVVGSAAYQLKELMRISRSYGFTFHFGTQRATPEDVPSTLKPGLTTMIAFRVTNAGDAGAMNLPQAADIRSEQKGRCAYEGGYMQYPYFTDETAIRLLKKYYSPLKAKMLKYSVADFHKALEGEGNDGMVWVKPYKDILMNITQFNPLEVYTRFLQSFNFKVERQTNSALGVQLIAERNNIKYAVLAVMPDTQNSRSSVTPKTIQVFKDGAKILGCENAIFISSSSGGRDVNGDSFFKFTADGEDLHRISEVLDNSKKLEASGNYTELFNKLVFAKDPVFKKESKDLDEDESNDDDDDDGSTKDALAELRKKMKL
jgi:hypothetical protein